MTLTVKILKETLAGIDETAIIVNEQNQEFVHTVCTDRLLISTTKPIGYCNRTGEYVYASIVNGYSAFSPALDEDLYDMEWVPMNNIKGVD